MDEIADKLITFLIACLPAILVYIAGRAKARADVAQVITDAAADAVKMTKEMLADASKTIADLKADYKKLQSDYNELSCLYRQQIDINSDLRERDAQRETELAKLKEQYETQVMTSGRLAKANKSNENEIRQLREKVAVLEKKTGPLESRV